MNRRPKIRPARTFAPPPPGILVRVNVRHEGRPKMVGKVFTLGGGRPIFYHEESGTQQHVRFDSPGGIDRCVLDYCRDVGVQEVHHARPGKTGEAVVLIAPLAAFLACPQRARYDGRDRVYLPRNQWQPRHRSYDVPFATAEVDLPLEDADAAQPPLPI